MQISESSIVAYSRINGVLVVNSTDIFNRIDLTEIMRVIFKGTPSNFPTDIEIDKIKSILKGMRDKYNDGITQDSYIIEFKDIGVKIDLFPFDDYERPAFNVLTEWLQYIKS